MTWRIVLEIVRLVPQPVRSTTEPIDEDIRCIIDSSGEEIDDDLGCIARCRCLCDGGMQFSQGPVEEGRRRGEMWAWTID